VCGPRLRLRGVLDIREQRGCVRRQLAFQLASRPLPEMFACARAPGSGGLDCVPIPHSRTRGTTPPSPRIYRGETCGTGANTPYMSGVGGIASSGDVRHSNEVAPASRGLARERRDRGDWFSSIGTFWTPACSSR
jgi:hypothetical protein